MSVVEDICRNAKEAAIALANMSTEVKDKALLNMADALVIRNDEIIKANEQDLAEGRKRKISAALMDRLLLDEPRIEEMAQGLRDIAALKDPNGEIVKGWRIPNGLLITVVRVPLGVIGMIYEARPNVTVDAAGLCVKTGNAVVLRGSSVALNSNLKLTEIISDAASEAGLPMNSIQSIPSASRDAANELMKMHKFVDVLIPRGGAALINSVIENSTVPVIETGVGNCHVYVDKSADLDMAERIAVNAKVQRPGVCNAAETLLVHQDIAATFLPRAIIQLRNKGVTIYGCTITRSIHPEVEEAKEEDWMTEYLDLKLAVRVVDSIDRAIQHIQKYGTKHSEAIVTEDYSAAARFTQGVDAAAVYINASTRFTDGGQFGMGAEIGISTQKLHARGPMALEALTSTKYIVYGSGQVRT